MIADLHDPLTLTWPELREGDRQPKSQGHLQGDWCALAIGHPLSAHEEVEGQPILVEQHVAEAEAQRQSRCTAAPPALRPGGACGFHVKSAPEVKRQKGLE
jgi:hypothetical protein